MQVETENSKQPTVVHFRARWLCVSFSKVLECRQGYSIVHTLANVIILSAKSNELILCYRICSHLDWSHWVNAWHSDKKQVQHPSSVCGIKIPTAIWLQWAAGIDQMQMWPFWHFTHTWIWPVNNICPVRSVRGKRKVKAVILNSLLGVKHLWETLWNGCQISLDTSTFLQ